MNDAYCPSPTDDYPLAAYRGRTISLLRRYSRAAMETGRLPALLGREFFRARVTSYTIHTFEDAVIFVFDMERCFAQLTRTELVLIARIVLQDFTQEEVARMLRIHQSNVQRRYFNALDHLTEILLDLELLKPSILAPRQSTPMAPCSISPAELVPISQNGTEMAPSGAANVLDLKACQEAQNANFAASA